MLRMLAGYSKLFRGTRWKSQLGKLAGSEAQAKEQRDESENFKRFESFVRDLL